MIIATVPLSERHVLALWSELECFVTTIADPATTRQSDNTKTKEVNVQHVILSTAYWARPIMEHFVHEVRTRIPLFMMMEEDSSSSIQNRRSTSTARPPRVTIEVQYYVNNRYDVGLWCDVLQGLVTTTVPTTTITTRNNNQYSYNKNSRMADHYILLNDSIFALRPYNGVLELLQKHQPTMKMTSLVYNTNPEKKNKKKDNNNNDGNNDIWLESVFRGFSGTTTGSSIYNTSSNDNNTSIQNSGIAVFMNHSCVGDEHPSFGNWIHRKSKRKQHTVASKRKRCITDYHEIQMAYQFYTTNNTTMTTATNKDNNNSNSNNLVVRGLYNGTVPQSMVKDKNEKNNHHGDSFPTWVLHEQYWREVLVNLYNFPAAKVNMEHIIPGNAGTALYQNPILQLCTKHLHPTTLFDPTIIRNFAIAKRTLQY